MKINQWTLGLAAVGVVSLASAVNAEEAKMNALQTALSSTTISGYVDTSIEWTPSVVNKSGLGFDSWPSTIPFRTEGKANGFNLNVVKLSIEKPMDESEWASGYKVDLLFGPDAVNYNTSENAVGGQQQNHFTGENGSDFGIKQAYVALRTPIGNGIDWKIGTYDTVIGYETFEAGNNPNFTRSWGYAIEPTQHTGILGTYRINDNIAIAAGVANTLMAGVNARNTELGTIGGFWHKTAMASIAITAPNDMGFLSGSTLYAGYVGGFAGGTEDQHNYYAGATLNTPVAGLKAGIAFDYVDHLYGSTDAGDYQDDAWIVGLYASYQATEKLSLHARAEYGDLMYSSKLGGGAKDEGDEYMTSLTGTLQYDLWKNVISRLEIRWDQLRNEGTFNDGEGLPGSVSNYQDVDTTVVGVYANFIYKF